MKVHVSFWFQFHKGTSKTEAGEADNARMIRFNSIKVRVKHGRSIYWND